MVGPQDPHWGKISANALVAAKGASKVALASGLTKRSLKAFHLNYVDTIFKPLDITSIVSEDALRAAVGEIRAEKISEKKKQSK